MAMVIILMVIHTSKGRWFQSERRLLCRG